MLSVLLPAEQRYFPFWLAAIARFLMYPYPWIPLLAMGPAPEVPGVAP